MAITRFLRKLYFSHIEAIKFDHNIDAQNTYEGR